MPIVKFIHQDGRSSSVDGKSGASVMETAIRHNIRGIDAECGGSCSCATCHVYVATEYFDRLPPADDMEVELLEGVAAPREPTSRLSCQILLTADLDGINVRIPATQS